ncbi:MAG: hypothetical protein MK066_14595 [Crocinitomicaceae bacterium]|nr:hypothetical protein [Crocinitomicaceae bacterium]
MKKPPIPTFIAHYPQPKQSKIGLIVILSIVAIGTAFGIYLYKQAQKDEAH